MLYYEKYIINLTPHKNLTVTPGGVLERLTPESPELGLVANDISANVIKEIGYYKNTVIPSIKETIKEFKSRVDAAKKAAMAEGQLSIIAVGMPIDNDAAFIYVPDQDYMAYDNIRLDSKDGEAVRELAGNSNFIDSISNDKLARVWEKYFISFGNDNSDIVYATTPALLTADSVNDIFIIHYILKGMRGVEYIDGSAGSLTEMRENMDGYYGYINGHIAKRIVLITNRIRTNNIIISKSKDNGYIIIVEDLYRPFLAASGTPDILYGAIQGRTTPVSIDHLISNKVNLTLAYKKYHEAHMSKVTSRILQINNDGLIAMITAMVTRTSNEEMYDEVKDYIMALDTSRLADPVEVMECIYADIIYKSSNLKKFLTLIRMYSERNTLRHAVTLTVSDMISSYLMLSVDVVLDD